MTGKFKQSICAFLNAAKNINLIVAVLFFAGALFGVEKNAEDLFGDGLLKSVEEDWPGAIEAFEKSYELEKNEDVKESLIGALMSKGRGDLLAERYSNALQCFDRILVLEPENSGAKKLHKIAESKTDKKAAEIAVKEKHPEKKVLSAPAQKKPEVPQIKSPVKPIPVREKKILPKKRKKKKKVVAKEKPPEKKVLPAPAQKKPEVPQIKSPVKPIPVRKKALRDNLWLKISAGIALIFFIIFISHLLKKKSAPPEIRTLPQPGKKFASKILLAPTLQSKQKLTSAPGKKYIPDRTTRVMLENPNAHVRARGVELIAEELRGSPLEIIERILVPCLSDSDSRVRANAAKALYEYNPGAAMNTLLAMAEYSDKWMRLSAAWAFEKIGTPEAIENLLLLADDAELRVRSRVIECLKRFYTEGAAPDELMQKLKKVLEGKYNG